MAGGCKCSRSCWIDQISMNCTNGALFATSQWPVKQAVYVMYRSATAVWFVGSTVVSGLATKHEQEAYADDTWKWGIFLTNWGFLLLTLYTICALLVSVVHWKQDKEEMPADVIEAHAHCSQAPYRWYHTVTWLLYSASYPAALVISGGFWVLIHRRGDPVGLSAAVTHASNSIYVLLDMCVSAVPVRVLHVWVPQCWCLCYAVFSFLYYLYGGTGLYELPFIYPFIDYGETPGVAIGFLAVALLLLLPLAQVALYVMYMVRRFVYARACGMAEEEDEDGRQRASVPV